jgi:hypothetical protein
MQQLNAPFTRNVLYPKSIGIEFSAAKFNHDKPSVGKPFYDKLVKNLTILLQ